MNTTVFHPKDLKESNNNTSNQQNSSVQSHTENEEIDFEGGFVDDESEHHETIDERDTYGLTGEKYGWYNGWSDDVIDDAFEGDPENTWNVD